LAGRIGPESAAGRIGPESSVEGIACSALEAVSIGPESSETKPGSASSS
jgi:hypothetical protein